MSKRYFMKIAVDAMGGDKAPEEIVKGALLAAGLPALGCSRRLSPCARRSEI